MQLDRKVIVVTGAAQGIGFSMTKALAARGARMVLVDMNGEQLETAVAELKSLGHEAHSYITNVAKEDDVVALFDQIASDLGQLNGLINNAGITRDELLIKADHGQVRKKFSLADWQAVIDVNLTGVFLCGREAAAQMVNHGCQGVIINISSISRAGNIGQTNYTAAKAAVAAMAVTWAKELARYNIRCAAIAPGFVATELVTSMNQTVLDAITAKIPLRRLGEPEEIARAAVEIFENDYLTGRVVEIDGGLRL